MTGPEIGKSALIIVDMQNDFIHSEGGLAYRAREKNDGDSEQRVVRGGSNQWYRWRLRPEYRADFYASSKRSDTGFRVARSL
jgi:formylglycine-generating enzyme required for sulfatase activity